MTFPELLSLNAWLLHFWRFWRLLLWSRLFCSCVGWQLYDLMTMALKYQVLLCPRPKDVLLVTFNHLDAIKGFIQDSPALLHLVDETFRQLLEVRCPQFITSPPQCLLSFLCSWQADSVTERTGWGMAKPATLPENSKNLPVSSYALLLLPSKLGKQWYKKI